MGTPNDSVNLEITNSPLTVLLTKDEERALIKRVKIGDRDAWDELYRKFQPLLKKQIRAYSRKFILETEDLESESFYCLIIAAARFDLRRKNRFSPLLLRIIKSYFDKISRHEQNNRSTLPWWEADIKWMYAKAKAVPQKLTPCAAASSDWPEDARRFIKRLRRRNDRMIAKWLWIDCPPLSQAEIADRLQVSRSAITQRRQKLEQILFLRFGRISFIPRYLEGYCLTEDDDDLYDGW